MSDIENIKAAIDEWNNGLDGGDIERMIASCDPEIITCNNGVPTKLGTQAVRDKYEPLIAGHHIKSGWEYEHIKIHGDMAIVSGFFTGRMTDKKTGDVRGGSGRLVLVYRRIKNGSWKMCLDMDNNSE
ncbi:DUF4440 domain-containing protein [Pyruvatibacter sp.]|uniref:YybH family protein n=1 Tax=Pyruvatibacter sp. TaxID=1981328 RepID=UPI0032657064